MQVQHITLKCFAAKVLLAMTWAAMAACTQVEANPGRQAGFVGQPMTEAPAKGNGSGIAVAYAVEPSAAAGLPANVTLDFSGVTDPAATVRLTADADLQLGAEEAVSQSLALGQSWRVVRPVPASEGVQYLNVFTTQNGWTSAVSIPVVTGKGAAKMQPMGAAKTDASGEAIIAIPVH